MDKHDWIRDYTIVLFICIALYFILGVISWIIH